MMDVSDALAIYNQKCPMSTTTLDSLPPEIILYITQALDLLQQARLSVCSKSLFSRLSSDIWYNSAIRDEVMLRACELGDLEIIHWAVTLGQNKSFVCRSPPHQGRRSRTTFRAITSTLAIAARHGRMTTFKYLLNMGAGLKDGAHCDPTALRPVFRTPEGIKYLRVCFDEGSEELKRTIAEFNGMSQFVLWISLGLSASIAEKILEYGGNGLLNHIDVDVNGLPHTPLGMAYMTGSMEVFNLLLRFGANINGENILGSCRNPPLFDAIYSMIEHQDIAILTDFLDLGADTEIWGSYRHNDMWLAYLHPRGCPDSESQIPALLLFLMSWESWSPDFPAIKVVKYLTDPNRSGPRTCRKPSFTDYLNLYRFFASVMKDMESGVSNPNVAKVLKLWKSGQLNGQYTLLWDQSIWMSSNCEEGCQNLNLKALENDRLVEVS